MDILHCDMPISPNNSALFNEWGEQLKATAEAASFEGCTITGAVKAIWTGWSIEAHEDLNGSDDVFIVHGGGLWAMIRVQNCFDGADGSLVIWDEFTPEERLDALQNAVVTATVVEDVAGFLHAWLVPDRFTGAVPVEQADWALALLDIDRPEIVAARLAVARGDYGAVQDCLGERARVRAFARAALERFDPAAVAARIMADVARL